MIIEENIFKKVYNKFVGDNNDDYYDFDKLKELTNLKNNIKNSFKKYSTNVKKRPHNKQEYYTELSEEVLLYVEELITKVQDYLIDYSETQAIDEEDVSFESLNDIINKFNSVKKDTSLVEFKDLLIEVYNELKKYFNKQSISNDSDVDDEHDCYKFYLSVFQYHPTDDFELLKKIASKVDTHTLQTKVSDHYKEVKNKNVINFLKDWKLKYREQWIDEKSHSDYKYSIHDFNSYDEFYNDWKLEHPTQSEESKAKNDYFTKWFNTVLWRKFDYLWRTKFKKLWLIDNEKSKVGYENKVSHLNESLVKLFSDIKL